MAKTVRVFRVEGTNICIVQPGSIHLGQGNVTVRWENETGGKIDILVPHDQLRSDIKHLELKSRKKPGEIQFHPPKVAKKKQRTYPYAVYCHSTKSFAYGGSDPEMIVP